MLNKTEEVNEYIKKLNHPLKAEIEEIREIILSANKDISEHIKWNAPSFVYDSEDRITFRLNKSDEIQLIFHRGAKVKDTKDFEFEDSSDLMKWLAKDRGVVTFRDKLEIKDNKDHFIKLINLWINTI